MEFDRDIYFEHVRETLFDGALEQVQVDGQNLTLGVWETDAGGTPMSDLRWLAYMLATVYHETGREMWANTEQGSQEYLQGQDYYPYIGRGLVHLTWEDNYRNASTALSLVGRRDLVEHPEMALDSMIATRVMFRGMAEGWFTGKKLGQYFSNTKDDALNARQIINGNDCDAEIKAYYEEFLEALNFSQRRPEMASDKSEKTYRSTKTEREVEVEPQAIVPGTWPSPIDGFRAAVAGVAVTVVNPAAGDALLPYPTGTPLAPGSKFWLTNGYYKSATRRKEITMALQTFKVRREQDPVLAVAVHSEITPKNWHRFPGGVAAGGPKPEWVRTNTWNGGLYGDDVTQAETNVLVDEQGRGDYGPRNQAEKATALGKVFVQDVGSPRGWVDPSEPYGPAPVSPTDDPTITSLAPNTAVAGAGQQPVWVTITGTKFTPWSTVETGGVYTPYSRYISPTKMAVLQDAGRSVPGIVVVKVIDHGVKSNGSNFTFT